MQRQQVTSALALLLLTALLITLLAGCTGSTVYNPSLNLPSKPMKKDGLQLSGGFNLLPQARPVEAGRPIEFGAQGIVRYAFHDRLTLALSWWGSSTSQFERQWGINGYAIFRLSLSDKEITSALIPAYGISYIGRTIEGEGAALWYAVWPASGETISTYAAAAPFIGWYSGDMDQNGYGGLLNLGAVIHLSNYVDLGLEAAGVVQVNRHDNITHVIPTPSMTITWQVQ